MAHTPSEPDAVLVALEELAAAARANLAEWEQVLERIATVRRLRAEGSSYRDMHIDGGSTIIDGVTRNQTRLTTAAAAIRRALARTLIDEGMSRTEIARIFGVSRQRVGVLVGNDEPTDVFLDRVD